MVFNQTISEFTECHVTAFHPMNILKLNHSVIKRITSYHCVYFFKHEKASLAMFEYMIKANEELKEAFVKEFDAADDQKLEKIIIFIKDLIIGKVNIKGFGFGLWCFSATFNTISTISWRSFVLVEVTGVLGETHHRPDKLYHIMLYRVHLGMNGIRSHNINIEKSLKIPKG